MIDNNIHASLLDNGIKTNFEISLKNVNTTGKNDLVCSVILKSNGVTQPIQNNKTSSSFVFLIPKLSLRLSPHNMKNNKDLGRRINIENIFASNRLSMEDSFEGGESITLGLNFKKKK